MIGCCDNMFHPRSILIAAPRRINWPKGKPGEAHQSKLGGRNHRFPKAQDRPANNQPEDEYENGDRKCENRKSHDIFDNAGHLNPNLFPAENAGLFAAVSLPPLHGIRVAHEIQDICFARSGRRSYDKFETIRVGDRKSNDDPSMPLEKAPRAARQ